MKTLRVLVFLISVASMSLAQSNANWPQWRGPNRDGISKETGLLKQWPAEGPALVWKSLRRGWWLLVVFSREWQIAYDGLARRARVCRCL